MQFGPYPSAGTEGKKPDRLATATQRKHEQSRAPVLAHHRIAHHRAGAVINLALFAMRRLDDRPSFRRYRSAQRSHEAQHTVVAAAEPVAINQILPDAH